MTLKKWNIAPGNKQLSQSIAARYNIPRYAAHLLVTRGYTDDQSIARMLNPAERVFCDPFIFADMDKAVERTEMALAANEKIMIYGDYDVDGITSTALLYSYLESRGADVSYMLPSRDEDGYGLHNNTIERMAIQGTQLIITVDNGISACEEIAYANELGIDVVVTDHHQPPDVLPEAYAIVNPHRADCPSTFKDYAGVGVAFKFVCALDGNAERILEQYADLAALGTIADVVPLLDENRSLVVHGLEHINKKPRNGILALLSAACGHKEVMTATDVAFTLSPRINSAGRLGKPDRAVNLMLSTDARECLKLANELEDENSRRHTYEREIADQAWRMLNDEPRLTLDRVVVVCGSGWNHGVIGIFAAKLCDALGKPCIILSSDGDVAKGSGRSLGSFSLHDAVAYCSDLLTTYGGHTMAVGLTLPAENVEKFRQMINEYAAATGSMPVPQLDIDCVLPLTAIDAQLAGDADVMEPFGAANPAPLIAVKGVNLRRVTAVGGGMHQRLLLESGGRELTAMLFSVPTSQFSLTAGDTVDCALSISRSNYRENGGVSAIIRDIRLSSTDVDDVIGTERDIETLLRGELISPECARRLCPSRSDFEAIYRFFLHIGFTGPLDVLAARLEKYGLDYAKMRTALCAMEQCGLLSIHMRSGTYTVKLNQNIRKVDLESSGIMTKIAQILCAI